MAVRETLIETLAGTVIEMVIETTLWIRDPRRQQLSLLSGVARKKRI
jgi:hypothetical protein